MGHTVAQGNSDVADIILEIMPEKCASMGLISAIPSTQQFQIQLDGADSEAEHDVYDEFKGGWWT